MTLENEDLVPFAVDLARRSGCEYSEARIHKSSDVTCFTRNGEAEPAMISECVGIGIRILRDGALAFGATNMLSQESVRSLVAQLVKEASVATNATRKKIVFSAEKAHVKKWSSEETKRVEDVSIESMVSYLREIDLLLSAPIRDVTFPNRNLFLGYNMEEKHFENSDGSRLDSRVTRESYIGILLAMYEGRPTSVSVPAGYAGLGGSGGWEIIENLRLHDKLPSMLKDITSGIKATAKPPKDESLDVILGPSVAGLTSHESCGHPGEADRILGREGAQAGESFLKPDKLGMQIGSQEAYVSDDPTIPHSMGFYLFDDEGVESRRRRLITAGKFTEFLQNRETAYEFGVKSNGSSRAVQYDREPIIRMGNTFIEPGDWTFDEMLKEIRHGLYIRSFMEWNIDDKRLNQRYVGLESYLIQNGELKEAVKDPVFEITTPKYWSSIDARASDVEFSCGTCGKGDPMQGAPVYIGAPHIRLRNVRIGAR